MAKRNEISSCVLKNNALSRALCEDEKKDGTMEISGTILLINWPFEEPTKVHATICVDQENWEMLQTIHQAKKEFIDVFGENEALLDALTRVDECVFTIAAQAYLSTPQISTRNLSAVADKLSSIIANDLPSIVVGAEADRVKRTHQLSLAPLFFSVYIAAVCHYALNSVSYKLRIEDFKIQIRRLLN